MLSSAQICLGDFVSKSSHETRDSAGNACVATSHWDRRRGGPVIGVRFDLAIKSSGKAGLARLVVKIGEQDQQRCDVLAAMYGSPWTQHITLCINNADNLDRAVLLMLVFHKHCRFVTTPVLRLWDA